MGRATASNDVFRAIADSTRREILICLGAGQRTVKELSDSFAISDPAVSQHLRVLREVGLVHATKQVRTRVYHLDPVGLKTVFDWVSHFHTFWDVKVDALEEQLARKCKKTNTKGKH